MNEDLLIEDKIISEFSKSLGQWVNYVTIGGGYAPIIYRLYFSDSEVLLPIRTYDLANAPYIPAMNGEGLRRIC